MKTYKKRRNLQRNRRYSRRGGMLKTPSRTQTQSVRFANTSESVKHLSQQKEGIPPGHERLLFLGEPLFTEKDTLQITIDDAPTLSKIKPTVSEYHLEYLMDALRSFSYADCHTAYTDESKTNPFYVYKTSQLIEYMEKQIENILTTKESDGYAFTTNDSTIIVQELRNYIEYFRKNSTPWDRLNTEYVTALFDIDETL
jgi:hypothetical protein